MHGAETFWILLTAGDILDSCGAEEAHRDPFSMASS